jgi:uncharacterized protein (TIGR02466 family)
MKIRSIFPEGIGLATNTDIKLDIESLMNTIKWKTDENGLGNFDQSQTNLQDILEWQPLLEWIVKKAEIYWTELGYKHDGMFITQSWLNKMPDGGNIDWHWHSNSLISAVYYLKADEGTGPTLFQTTKNPLQLSLQTEVDKFTDYNCPEIAIRPVQDTVVLFPSYINHRSAPNFNANSERYTVAVNIMPNTLGKENHFNWAKLHK